jgi:hypothetical protein
MRHANFYCRLLGKSFDVHIRWIGTERPQANYIGAGEHLGQLARQTLCVLDWQRLIVVHEKNRVDPFQFKLVAVTGKSKKISFGVAYSHH